jgi:UDP-3-O-[3-hydroxymyristoyl] N-acetylglucosamine deacetylase
LAQIYASGEHGRLIAGPFSLQAYFSRAYRQAAAEHNLFMYQSTLRGPCRILGIGLHSGQHTGITLLPAPVNSGIVFRVREGDRQVDIPARSEYVVGTTLNTTLGRDEQQVCTVEHLLAALAGLEIDNAIIVTDGHEIPAMDGSAQPFVTRIMEVGRKIQPTLRQYLRILEPVYVQNGDRFAGLYPAVASSFVFSIDFNHPAIQTQTFRVRLTPQTFVSELARARTFGFIEDLETLKERGLARGAGLENAVGLSREGQVLNGEGLRYPDEFVRHKIVDAIGDLSLAGHPILGEYRGIKSGHMMNSRLLVALAERTQSWELVTGSEEAAEAV